MKQWAEIHWHTRTGKTKVIVTDDPQGHVDALRRKDEFFICYPMNAPIPRNNN